MKPDQPVYEDIVKFPELKKFMEEKLEDYNMEPGIISMGLVLFRDAIEHGGSLCMCVCVRLSVYVCDNYTLHDILYMSMYWPYC